MAALTGLADPKTRRGGRLGIDHPVTTKTLAALSWVDTDLADLRRFSNRLALEADAWMRRGGVSQRGRIGKREANRLLQLAMSGVLK